MSCVISCGMNNYCYVCTHKHCVLGLTAVCFSCYGMAMLYVRARNLTRLIWASNLGASWLLYE